MHEAHLLKKYVSNLGESDTESINNLTTQAIVRLYAANCASGCASVHHTSRSVEAFAWLLQEPQRRQNLWQRVQQLGDLLGVAVKSPIIPLVVGDEAAALSASALLLRRGFHVPAIRPPTVPNHTSR